MTKAEHGTRSRYVLGCRCPECREANTAYQRTQREQFRRAPGADAPAHGTRRRYVRGCLCADCREANRLKTIERRKRVVAARGEAGRRSA